VLVDDTEPVGDQIPSHPPESHPERETGGQPREREDAGVPAERGASPAAAQPECTTNDDIEAATAERDDEGVDETGKAVSRRGHVSHEYPRAVTANDRVLGTELAGALSRARIFHPDTGKFDVELGPVFCNFLLADEINRAPAKVQSALLEVMQEQQVTLGGHSYPVPRPFLVLATQNPIESEGTYQLPEAQLDRFLFKLMVDYPTMGDEAAVVEQSLAVAPAVREVMQISELDRFREVAARVFVDRRVIGYAVRLADATRHPEQHGLADLKPMIEYGASPRGPIGLAQSARALALLRGRDYATSRDVKDVAADVLRHRLVLSYEALADGVSADDVLRRVLAAVDPQDDDRGPEAVRPYGR